MGEVTNSELVRAVADGDRTAWGTLVERFSQTVWHATGKYDLDRSTRLDVVQTVWLRLHDRIAQIREPERLPGWLVITARNECVNVLRQRSRLVALGDTYEAESDEPAPGTNLERSEAITAVVEALDELDDRCCELLQLLAADPPPSYEDVSQLLGIPIGSIGPTRARCLQKLKNKPSIARILAHR